MICRHSEEFIPQSPSARGADAAHRVSQSGRRLIVLFHAAPAATDFSRLKRSGFTGYIISRVSTALFTSSLPTSRFPVFRLPTSSFPTTNMFASERNGTPSSKRPGNSQMAFQRIRTKNLRHFLLRLLPVALILNHFNRCDGSDFGLDARYSFSLTTFDPSGR